MRRGILAALFLIFAFYLSSLLLRYRGNDSASRSVQLTYNFLLKRDYEALAREHLATASAIQTLQEAERRHGSVSGWETLKSDTHLLGRPTQIDMLVHRTGGDFVDVLALGDSVHVHIVMELEVADWRAGSYERALRVIATPPKQKRP